jgi:fructokinase
VNARWGAPAQGNQIDIIAYYIAQLVHTLVLAYAPQRVIIGGGVAKTPGLLGAVRSQAAVIMRDYLGPDHPLQHPESGFIVAPELGDYSGLHGAMELAGAL